MSAAECRGEFQHYPPHTQTAGTQLDGMPTKVSDCSFGYKPLCPTSLLRFSSNKTKISQAILNYLEQTDSGWTEFDEHFPWGTYVGRWGRDIHIRADDRVRVAVFGEIWQRNNCRCEDPSCPKFWKTKWCEKVSVQVVAVSTGGIITGVVLSQLNSDPNVGPDHGLVYFPYDACYGNTHGKNWPAQAVEDDNAKNLEGNYMSVVSGKTFMCMFCQCTFPTKQKKICSGCRDAVYCSPACQKEAWTKPAFVYGAHKARCKKLKLAKEWTDVMAQMHARGNMKNMKDER